MKPCPFCAEDIQDAAIKCRYCGSMVDEPPRARMTPATSPSDKRLPFTPITGASPTSFALYFVLSVVLAVLSLLVGPFGTLLLVLGTSAWVAIDASTHKLAQYQNGLGGPVAASLGSLLLWIIVFPW